MSTSRFNERIYHRLHKASNSLRQHRTVIILGAFIFWTAMLGSLGYFREFNQTNRGILIFGFLWMTVPVSFATYLIPRLLLRGVPLMNGYNPDKDD